ncbi:hypothetical protein FKM82_018686 [Ascaphus truei]
MHRGEAAPLLGLTYRLDIPLSNMHRGGGSTAARADLQVIYLTIQHAQGGGSTAARADLQVIYLTIQHEKHGN